MLFGLLAASLLNKPQPYSPIKFGLVWNVDKRTWVHWDGNTQSPDCPQSSRFARIWAHRCMGNVAIWILPMVKRQTDLSENIRPPQYPFKIDQAAAKRGAFSFRRRIAIPATADRKATNAFIPLPKSGPIRIGQKCSHKNWRMVSTHSSLSSKRKDMSRQNKWVFAARENIGRRP